MHANVANFSDCCELCAASETCQCWDYNAADLSCYTKTDCDTKVPADRVTGKVGV